MEADCPRAARNPKHRASGSVLHRGATEVAPRNLGDVPQRAGEPMTLSEGIVADHLSAVVADDCDERFGELAAEEHPADLAAAVDRCGRFRRAFTLPASHLQADCTALTRIVRTVVRLDALPPEGSRARGPHRRTGWRDPAEAAE